MIFNWEFTNGLVFGISSDDVYLVEEDEKIDEYPSSVIYVFLGLFILSIIFPNYNQGKDPPSPPPGPPAGQH